MTIARNPVGRPFKWTDPDELTKKIDEYFDSLYITKTIEDPKSGKTKEYREYLEPPTVSGLALALETTRGVLIDYQNQVHTGNTQIIEKEVADELRNTITRAKSFIESYAERSLFENRSAQGPIFALRNNWPHWNDDYVIRTPDNKDATQIDLNKLSTNELEIFQKLYEKMEIKEEEVNGTDTE